jgi:hemolysin activation/secretion protein
LHSKQSLGKELVVLYAEGNLNSFTSELSHPLYRLRLGQLKIKGGYSIRESRNFQLGDPLSRDNLRVFHVSLGGNYTDRFWGRTFAELKFNQGISDSNKIDLNPTVLVQKEIFFMLNFTSPVFKAQGLLEVILLLEVTVKFPAPAHFL